MQGKYILKKPSIDRNKKRIGMYIAVGGSTPYKNTIYGWTNSNGFFL